DGVLVYEVEIGSQEVIIDAGNGKVLSQGARDADDHDHDSGNDD
ncbi:peptidase, partial [Escherichia coli]